MRKTILFTLYAMLVFGNQRAFSQTFEWAKQFGGPGNEDGRSIAVDASGNVISVGNFENTIDFDPGSGSFDIASNGESDVFITKLDADGNLIWAKSIGAALSEKVNDVTTDASGNSIVVGTFLDSVDFDPGVGSFYMTSAGAREIFILKLDAAGDFVWAKKFGGATNNYIYAVDTDASGNVYTTGYFQSTTDFDPNAGVYNLSPFGNEDVYVSKLDASGNFVWAQQIGGTSSEAAYSLSVDGSGNVLITGDHYGAMDSDPGAGTYTLTSNGQSDIFVVKLTTDGDFTWATQFGGPNYEIGQTLTTDSDGNVYVTGGFGDTIDIDPGAGMYNLITHGNDDAFIVKLDTSGNFVWGKQIGGTGYDYAVALVTDVYNDLYITGFFQDEIDFDPNAGIQTLSAASGDNTFIVKWGHAGSFAWAEQFGAPASVGNRAIATFTDGSVYSVGYFEATSDFENGPGTFNLTSAGYGDAYVHKMSQCLSTSSTSSVTACGEYFWAQNNMTYTASGTYSDTIPNANQNGCDSIVVLHLIVTIPVVPTVTNSNNVLTAQPANLSYTWMNCTTGMLVPGATGTTFTPTVAGNYAAIGTDTTNCSDTSACVTATVGLDELSVYDVKLAPNPTTGSVHLSFDATTAQLRIVDGLGQLIRSTEVTPNQYIDLSNCKPGVYFFEIIIDDKKTTYRIIKH